MESISLWKPVLCPAQTHQNGFKHKERMNIREEGIGGLQHRGLHLCLGRVQLWAVSYMGMGISSF